MELFNSILRGVVINMRMLLMLVGILFVSACGEESLVEQHKVYLSNKGWEIKASIEVETYILDIPNEMLSNYEASGISFLSEHLGEEVTAYSYELKEKDSDGEHLKAVIFEAEKEIIGGYGILPNWAPGTFNLGDKERLISEKKLNTS